MIKEKVLALEGSGLQGLAREEELDYMIGPGLPNERRDLLVTAD